MAGENAQLARAGYEVLQEAYRTGDLGALRQLFDDTLDSGFVVTAEPEMFIEGEWRGPDGMLRFVANQMEALDDMWIEPHEYIEVGPDRVVVPVSFGGRARHTEVDVQLAPVHVWTVREGKVAALHMYRDREEALAYAKHSRSDFR